MGDSNSVAEEEAVISKQPGSERSSAGFGMQPGRGKRVGREVWMPVPTAVPGLHPALWYFSIIDQIIVVQLMEIGEFFGFEQANRYIISNKQGQQIYYALETSNFMQLHFAHQDRAFAMHIVDNRGQEVIRMHRPMVGVMVGSGWNSHILVECPPGKPLGEVHEDRVFCGGSTFNMVRNGNIVASVPTPCCVLSSSPERFPMQDGVSRKPVGAIEKYFGGYFKEYFSNADTFGVKFDMDMDPEVKVLALATTFLIDYRYYENKNDNGYGYGYGYGGYGGMGYY